MKPLRFALLVLSLHALPAGCGMESTEPPADTPEHAAELTISVPGDDRNLLDAMTAFASKSGVGYSVVSRDTGESVPGADVYFGESFVNLWEAAERDAFRPVDASLQQRLATLRLADPEHRFLPLAATRKTIAFNRRLVTAEEIQAVSGFEGLADDRWHGRLCLTSSKVDGNRLLVAHLIREHDVREAEIIVRRWLGNLAVAEFADDTALAAAIADGRCAVGILDAYRVSQAERASGEIAVAPGGISQLFDIRGVGISRHAEHPAVAGELLAWLLSRDGTAAYIGDRPLTPLAGDGYAGPAGAASLTDLERAAILSELGFLQEEAGLLIERAGYR